MAMMNNWSGLRPAGEVEASSRAPSGGGDVDRAWERMFGESTPDHLVQQRDANGGALPPSTSEFTTGPGFRSAEKKPTSTPEQAGTMNAVMPGIFNGNPANGFPSAEAGFVSGMQSVKPPPLPPPPGQPQGSAAGVPPPPAQDGGWLSRGESFTNPLASMPGVEQPNAASYAGTGVPAGWFGMTGEQRAAALSGAGGGGWGGASATAAAAPQGGQFNNATQESNRSPGSPPPAPPAPVSETAAPTGTAGAPGTPGSASAPPQQTPQMQAEVQAILKGFDKLGIDMGGTKVNPNFYQPLDVPGNADPTEFGLSSSPNYIKDAGARHLALKLDTWAGRIEQVRASGGDWQGDKATRELVEKYDNTIRLLQAQGINYDPLNYQAPAGGGGGTGGGAGGGTGGGTTGGAYDNIPNLTSAFGLVNKFFTDAKDGGIPAEQRAAAAETALNIWAANEALARRQRGEDTAQDNLDFASDLPFKSDYAGVVGEMFDNPDPTDWQGIKNRLGSDYDAAQNSAMTALGASAARRGLSPSAVAGITSRTTAENRSDLARAIGELDNQAALQRRSGQQGALQAAAGYGQAYSNPELQARSALVAAILGAPQQMGSPVEGLSGMQQGVGAYTMAKDAYDDSLHGGGGIGDYLSLGTDALGGLGMGLVGGTGQGGIMAALKALEVM